MKSVVIHSGGLDSTVLLYELANESREVKALSFNYGQRHVRELDAARSLCALLGVEHRIADLRAIAPLLSGSSLTSDDIPVPDGHYSEEVMKTTVVPNRNMIMLSIAAGWAISRKFDRVAYAAHGGDHAIYPDCRPGFADAVDNAIRLADWHRVSLYRPFVSLTKADIVRRGAALGVPFEKTWSCYKGGPLHCGVCGTCIERREAFSLAGIPDPTAYDPAAPSVAERVRHHRKLPLPSSA
ncbi:MAG: 7-cyano-7-deazaguanine synthase QueC [Opitutaceae bacterium]|jgi:7-cyano-7-deazaguanine synthase|nr:7-cyano-7-deazaguanine synthase QueC [Opitutaceae bacterium]